MKRFSSKSSSSTPMTSTTNPQQLLNIWSKIKKVLKSKGIKDKDKLYYKQSIGFDLIDKNK